MGFIYRFVSLDEEQSLRRRHLLDGYGQFAQLSVLLLPLLFQLFLGLRLLAGRLVNTPQASKEHQSPVVSRFGESKPGSSRHVKPLWARLRWMLDDEVADGWGTRLQWIIAGLWTLWLLTLVVKDTGDDYLHLTKRFGIVAASQLPIHYILAAKSWSPIQYLTRMSHEELNPYHRLLGRIIITFLSIHAAMYLNFYIQSSLLLKRIQDRDVVLGLTAISILLLIGTTALTKVRNWSYRLFFYLHVVLSITVLPVLYFHVSHLRAYILESAAIYILLILQRNVDQTSTQATIELLPSTNLLSISIPLPRNQPLLYRASGHSPGQHIYLGFPSLSQKLRINPFTIASKVHRFQIQIVARTLSGTTATLANLATQPQPIPLTIEGPYGAAAWFPNLESYDRVLFVAGGVGATFTLPIYRDLLYRRSASGQPTPALRFVWTVRKFADAQWGIDRLQGLSKGFPSGFELCVTEIADPRIRHFESAGASRAGRAESSTTSFELQENTRLLDQQSEDANTSTDEGRPDPNADLDPDLRAELEQTMQRVRETARLMEPSPGVDNVALDDVVVAGRPDLRAVVDEVFGHNGRDRVAVLVCGPKGMGASVRKEVGRWVGKGRDVFWHSEEFAW